jgi:hypothetical protein
VQDHHGVCMKGQPMHTTVQQPEEIVLRK